MLGQVPKPVPVYAHRFLPAGHGAHGHPVLSVWGTDTTYYGYYGADLADCINHESDDFSDHT